MTKNKIIFVDSDGTVMDSMTPKHTYAFGPAFVKTFELEKYEKEVLEEWNRINLYSETRGVNRFDGSYMMLQYVDKNFKRIDFLDDYQAWLKSTSEKSNKALKDYIEETKQESLKKVLNWSILTNELIDKNKDKVFPFSSAVKALEVLSKKYTIIIISSANGKAVEDEWKKFDVMKYTNEVCTQELGTKEVCISKMLQKYQPTHALMIGDALGDLDSTIHNAINFYPIKPKLENESWDLLLDTYEKKFYQNNYLLIQNEINTDFKNYLKG